LGSCTRCGASYYRRELVIGMNERARAILSEAFATIERSEAQRDEVLADIAQRQAVTGATYSKRQPELPPIVYKTTEQPKPQVAPTMDPDTLARWNEWFDDRFARSVQKRLEEFAVIIGEHTGEAEKHLLTEVKTLRAIVDALHIGLTEDVAELRNELRSMNAKNVTPLRGAHNVA
jgi:hypothetical protein